MTIFLFFLASLVGIVLLALYFRSIVVVALLNSKSTDWVERTARRGAVAIIQRFISHSVGYEEIQKRQAWIMPLFVLIAVVTWFLLVQLAFTGILWGLRIEPEFWRALSSSGSALSTLGYLTPSTLVGEYLAVFQAAIGLAVVMLLFTFVPGYQASIQTRERRVGWFYARTHDEASSERYLAWLLKKRDGAGIDQGWEDWENWFRGIRETHTLSPILSYVPSIYPGTSWIATGLSVLDTATALTVCLGEQAPDEARICQREGTMTMRLTAEALGVGVPGHPKPHSADTSRFDNLYDALVAAGLPVIGDRAECLRNYVRLRAEYAPSIQQIARATLTPATLLDVKKPAHVAATTTNEPAASTAR